MKTKRSNSALTEHRFRTALLEAVRDTERSGKLGTANNYRASITSFLHYLQQANEQLKLTPQLMARYEHWLKNKGMLRNSTSFYMRNLRALFRTLHRKGALESADIFNLVYTGVDRTRKRAMPPSSLTLIKQADLSDSPTLAFYRDLFLFSFYCRGMSFVDLSHLRHENIHKGYIHYVRRKTGQTIEVRLEKCMEDIIQRHPGNGKYVFPIITSPDPIWAFRQYRSSLCIFNRALKQLAKRLGIPPFSSYTSRHTWATIAHSKYIPISIISESMGHASEAVTQIYLASFNQSTIDEANRKVIDI